MEAVVNSSDYLKQEERKKNNSPLNYNETNDVTLLPSVVQLFKKIIAKESFISHKIYQRIITNNGSNYLGDLYEVDITGETKHGPKELYIFLKHVISGAMMSVVDIKKCYARELLFYTDVSNIFDVLQNDTNLLELEKFKVVKSYECSPDVIILENLAKKGFKTLDRMDVIPLELAELSITQIAKFHGLSFVLKHTRKDYFENKIKTLQSLYLFDDVDTWNKIVKNNVEMTITHFDTETHKKIKHFINNSFYDKVRKYITGDTGFIKCLCHGDFKMSNIMCKIIEDKATDAVLVDYQFMYYGSPVIDLLFFFYTATDRKFRNAHMVNLKNLYHDELTKFLQYFYIDINDIYSKKVFETEFMDSLDYGLMCALYSSHIIFLAENEMPDFSENSYIDTSFKLDDRYKERITDAVEEYMEWGIL